MEAAVSTEIGSWSEYEADTWRTFVVGNNSDHSMEARALSNLSSTKALPNHPRVTDFHNVKP